MFTIVSWYTLNTPYKEVIETHLLPSLEKLKLPYKIYPIESLKNWKENTNLKSIIIEKALNEIETDLLILDADCKVNCYPELLDKIPIDCDIGLFYLDWGSWYGHSFGKKELCSGTIFLRNNHNTKKLIDDWKNLSKKNNNELIDQKFLEMALKMNNNLNIFDLPLSYCWINSMPDGSIPKVKRPENVTIEHFQASRRLRKNI